MPFDMSNYVPVHERLAQFWDEWPEGRIETKMIGWDMAAGWVVMQALVFRTGDDAQPAAIGHAQEVRDDPKSFVNSTSFIENCETSAIGRALATLGFEIKGGMASREEMQKVERMQGIQQGIQNLNDGTAAYSPPSQMQHTVPAQQQDLISERQIKMMRDLAPERGLDLDIWTLQMADSMPGELSKTRASQLIDILMAMPKNQPAPAVSIANVPPGPVNMDGATVLQINAIAQIAATHNVSVGALVNQAFEGVTDPAQLTKQQASHVIKTYGSKG
jgi:hypothetical protein